MHSNYVFCFYSASERLLEMLGTVVAYVDDVLVSIICIVALQRGAQKCHHFT